MEERKTIDCRKHASAQGCTLTITGRADEVLRAGMQHVQATHGMPDTPDTRAKIQAAIEPAGPAAPEPGRKVADCRTMPSEINCSLTYAGREDEVVKAAAQHATTDHKHPWSPELEKTIRSSLADERS